MLNAVKLYTDSVPPDRQILTLTGRHMLHYNVETQLGLVFEDMPYAIAQLQLDGNG
jgi:hypothetical protein